MSKTSKEISILEDHLFCVNEDGMIEKVIAPEEDIYASVIQEYEGKTNFHRLSEGQYFLPGFVDLHVHAPQWAQSGTALDLPLYKWLHTYTFPLEAKFSDPAFAEKVYRHLVTTLLKNGTTTALYFATIHQETSYLLAEICAKKGQRGLVGKVVADDPEQNPGYYRDQNVAIALAETEQFILDVKELAQSTKQGVYPVVTPRFVPSCTDEALQGLGKLAAKYDTYIQSHCSESDWEHEYVKDRFAKNDAFVLHDFGLLRDKSVLAHSVFLEDKDVDLFAETGAAIGHCPLSNAYFADAVAPISALHSRGVDIGLGTDISAGAAPSIYDSAKQTIVSSRILESGVDPSRLSTERGVTDSRVTINEAFYFATAGGGESLGLPIGRLEENYAWDVQIVDTKVKENKLPIFDSNEDLYEVFQKVMYLVKPENILEVWVQGEKVNEGVMQ